MSCKAVRRKPSFLLRSHGQCREKYPGAEKNADKAGAIAIRQGCPGKGGSSLFTVCLLKFEKMRCKFTIDR